MRSVRRRSRLAKSTEAVMQFVEAEVAKLLAADPAVDAARKRAIRRAGRSAAARASSPEMLVTH